MFLESARIELDTERSLPATSIAVNVLKCGGCIAAFSCACSATIDALPGKVACGSQLVWDMLENLHFLNVNLELYWTSTIRLCEDISGKWSEEGLGGAI